LGYILIDHDVNIQEGMQYVQKALEKEPDSSYYLDSLAWGHYKLGECQEASEIMKKVVNLEGGDNAEVLLHIKAIEKCLKMKKVGRK
jgi:Tfp pilus assembly protein PilF